MSFVSIILDLFIHLDKNLEIIMQNYGVLVYPLLFLIVFLETGLVVTPFLPGDSLIFAAATISAKDFLNIYLLFIIISLAAVIGDALNYFIGKTIGREIVKRKYIKAADTTRPTTSGTVDFRIKSEKNIKIFVGKRSKLR